MHSSTTTTSTTATTNINITITITNTNTIILISYRLHQLKVLTRDVYNNLELVLATAQIPTDDSSYRLVDPSYLPDMLYSTRHRHQSCINVKQPLLALSNLTTMLDQQLNSSNVTTILQGFNNSMLSDIYQVLQGGIAASKSCLDEYPDILDVLAKNNADNKKKLECSGLENSCEFLLSSSMLTN